MWRHHNDRFSWMDTDFLGDTVYGKFQQLVSKAKLQPSIVFADSLQICFIALKLCLSDLNSPILKGWGSTSRARCPSTTGIGCRIKTGHSNLVSCLARGWGRWLRYFTEAKAEVKYRASARIRGPKHDTRFEWPVSILIMTRYPSFPSKLTKQVSKIPVYLRSPTPFDSAVTTSARLPDFECTHLLLRSADWWRHKIIFSIARTIWILSECKLSTDSYVNY